MLGTVFCTMQRELNIRNSCHKKVKKRGRDGGKEGEGAGEGGGGGERKRLKLKPWSWGYLVPIEFLLLGH